MQSSTTVERNDDGWTFIRCGPELTIIVPTSLESLADARVEIRCHDKRVFVEATDDGMQVSQIESLQDSPPENMWLDGRWVRRWDNYWIAGRTAYGHAARNNRGAYSGSKIHALYIEEVVGLVDDAAELALARNTVGMKYLRTRKPALFSVRPACGCTQGQHAGRELNGLTLNDVTCTKCTGGTANES